MPNTNYNVYLRVEGASDLGRVALAVANKARNAFTIENRGTADDLVVWWMAVHQNWR
jgi:hypothetical protein